MFVVTGASGWLGRNALLALEAVIGEKRFSTDVLALCSRRRWVDFGGRSGLIRAEPLEALSQVGRPLGMFHAAFIKRNGLQLMSVQEYISANRAITACVARFLESHQNCPIVNISSGAAGASSLSIHEDPYGFLKLESERVFADLAGERVAVSFRVFGVTGAFAPDDSHYALTSFIKDVKRKAPIFLSSTNPVWRSYVSAMDLARLSWCLLSGSPFVRNCKVIDAVTHTIELGDLAVEVNSLLGGVGIQSHRQRMEGLPDEYIGNDRDFRKLMNSFQLSVTPLRQQILDTASRNPPIFNREFS